ncbi:hypothetical protein ABZ942_23370 [Nocardia sp. NPDC046473]|uniref:hypothetical protein n=1 Tax=Nocardia sp. NPDC046473 TaxID=3155733 RepID=UPI0033E0D598
MATLAVSCLITAAGLAALAPAAQAAANPEYTCDTLTGESDWGPAKATGHCKLSDGKGPKSGKIMSAFTVVNAVGGEQLTCRYDGKNAAGTADLPKEVVGTRCRFQQAPG